MKRLSYFIISIILFVVSVYGCSTSHIAPFHYSDLKENNFSKLNGIYSFYPKKDSLNQNLKINAYQYFDPTFNLDHIDSVDLEDRFRNIEISVISNKEIEVKYLIDGKERIKKKIKGKLKKGEFYFEDNFTKVKGIPFVLGTYETERKSVGYTTKGNLILSSSNEKMGGILFISAGKTTGYTLEVERDSVQ